MSRTLKLVPVVAAIVVGGCSTSAGNATQACATFDHAYRVWQHSSHDETARAAFISGLDNASASAGNTQVSGALQAVAANVRELTGNHRVTPIMTRAIALVRKTCPTR